MAKDASTSTARDLSSSENGPEFAGWLLKELRHSRADLATSAPSGFPAPESQGSGASAGESVPASPAVATAAVAAAASAATATTREADVAPPPSAVAEPAAAATVESTLDPASDEGAPELDDEVVASGAGASAFYAGAAAFDELDDSDDTFSEWAAAGDSESPGAAELSAAEGSATSLSPQVLPSDDEDDAGVPLLIPGAGPSHSAAYLRIAGAAAAIALLVFLIGHRLANRHADATAAHSVPPPPARLQEPAAAPAPVQLEELALEPEKSSTKGTGHGGSDYYSSKSPPSPPSDPSRAGGPSVARFPDLPRELLIQLEQVFEANSTHKNGPRPDSVDGFQR